MQNSRERGEGTIGDRACIVALYRPTLPRRAGAETLPELRGDVGRCDGECAEPRRFYEFRRGQGVGGKGRGSQFANSQLGQYRHRREML